VGEVLGCLEFLKRLRAEFPRTQFFVSSTTLAGHATAREKLQGIADSVFYAPVDYVFAVRSVLRTLQPVLVVVAETEIWPNLFREVRRTGAGLAIVNGRISDRAFPRYLPFRWFFQAVLPAADLILAQSETHRDRFTAIGAPADRVRTGGNFKYDFEPRPAPADSPVAALVERMRPSKVWIAASTMPPASAGDIDEDDVVIETFQKLDLLLDVLLILAPRKPERFDVVARKLEASAIRYVRRSRLAPGADARVLLLDTIGELSGLFGLADAVFMGGTLARRGGHNILEPAMFGKPIVVGPHMENFQAIADDFSGAQACVAIPGPAALLSAVEELLRDPGRAREIGRRALICAEAKRGATALAVTEVRSLYRVPAYRPPQPWFSIAWVLSRIWRAGGRRRSIKALTAQKKLDVPVISVGNLSMGGTGKTPCVLLLTEALKQRNYHPGILTRGHGRKSLERTLAIPAGVDVPAEHSGDEPLIFLRSGLAPVGIGVRRWEAGTLLIRQFGVNVLVLDDGFQHQRLARSVDIVLIDALDPFGGGDVFPLGRLREPQEALNRADVILITRSDLCDTGPAVERAVRHWNGRAPIFRARFQPQAWVENRTGREFDLTAPPFARAGAFCGLGNPQSFRRTLESIGIIPAGWVQFGDHHRYRPKELRRVSDQMRSLGADAVVTTQKDTVNLCEEAEELLAPLPLFWLKIRMAIEREEEFMQEIARHL
jgi:tetraacyldisaccharide 4'-kinase